MSRLPAIALILLSAGCARERVAYELHYTSEPVARRTPRRTQPAGFPASAYAHDDPRHRCDARCDTYWPDVHAHGHADHRCDTSCGAYEAPRRPRSVSTSSSYQSPTYVSSPLTGGSTSAGVRVGVTYDEPYRPQPVTPPPVPVRAAPAARVEVTYAHGHAQHRCGTWCGSYVVVHGQAGHRCHTGCGGWTAWPHGHVRHRCGPSCSVYDYPHGHARHACTSLCAPGVALRTSNGRFELRIGGNRPHGDRFHACNTACSWYTPPSAFYAHGHRLHACGRGCGAWAGWSTWRAASRRIDDCPPVRRPTVVWPSRRDHRDHGRWQHRSSRSRRGVDIGFGIRIR